MDDFAYVASGDLMEPLRGINIYGHHLKSDVSTEESKTRLANLIMLTVHMFSLLDSLLYLSRVPQHDEVSELCDLNGLVQEAFEMVDTHGSEVKPEFFICRPLPSMKCGGIRLREIFFNLISNGLEYKSSPARKLVIGFVEPGES